MSNSEIQKVSGNLLGTPELSLSGPQKCRTLVCITSVLFFLFLTTSTFATSSTRIASIQVEGLRHIALARVLGLFPCKEGDVYTSECVSTAERYLKDWKVFDNIHITTTPAADGVHIAVTVQEALLVGAIDISGNYPFLGAGLERRLTLRPGDTFSVAGARAQTERLASIYLKAGYLDTSANFETIYDADQNDMVIQYDIHRGRRIKLGRLTVAGNHALPYGRFLSTFNPYKTYSIAHRRYAVRRLTEIYRKKGYLRAHVKVAREEFDAEKVAMDVDLIVTEGPPVTIRFLGNKGISIAKLKKVITLVRDGTYDEVALEDSVAAMTDLYHRHGYDKVDIRPTKEDLGHQGIRITFTVTEGPHSVINHVNFVGNTLVPGGRLRKQVLSKPISLLSAGSLDPVLLKFDRQSLINYYKSIGYENVHIDGPEIVDLPRHPNQVNLNFHIMEGMQLKVSDITTGGVDEIQSKDILNKLINKTTHPYNALALASDTEIVEMWLRDNGYPYATVLQTVTRSPDGTFVSIHYDIQGLRQVKIGEILLVGNTLTSQRAVRGNIEIKPGDIYSARKILESEFALRRLGVFKNVRIETMGMDEHSDAVHLVIRMEELRPLVVDVSAGFATDDLYTGSLTFTNFNTFGWAKRLGLRFIGGQRLSRGEITWTDPRFLNHDLQWNVNGLVQFIRLPYFSYVQPSVGTGFFRRFHRTSYLARYQLDKNYFMSGDATRAATAGIRNSTLSKISLSATFDTRNSFSDPTSGYFLLGAIDLVNEIRGDKSNFVKFRAGAGVYTGFWKIFALLNDLRFNRIETIGKNINVPGNERFFLGGDSSIRGFSLDSIGPKDANNNAIGANLSWVHNIELRIKFSNSFQLACWHDMGSLTDTWSQINRTTFKESMGPGIRIMTPVGPIKIDYGIVLPPKQASDPDQRFHLSFGNVF